MRRTGCAEAVETAHCCLSIGAVNLHYLAECFEINFTGGLLVGPYAVALAVGFAVVKSKVLFVNYYALGLYALAFACTYRCRNEGIFGIVLKVTSAVCVAVSVCGGAVNAVSACGMAVFTDKFADAGYKFLVPGGCAEHGGKRVQFPNPHCHRRTLR